MHIDVLTKLIDRYDGNYSVLYLLLKDRIDAEYTCDDVPFWEEFMCFENDYFIIAREIVSRLELRPYDTIVDIGCAHGFQSAIFDEHQYIGVEAAETKFFNRDNTHYIRGLFPEVDVDLRGKIVISNMSLGFFSGVDLGAVASRLSKAPQLFIRTTDELLNLLLPFFKGVEVIKTPDDEVVPMYYLYGNIADHLVT